MVTVIKKRLTMICRMSKQAFIHGITPISNMYIFEYLPDAPGDFVKVYLYAFMACFNQQNLEMNDIARDLKMDSDVVRNAFHYWERRGLIMFSGGVFEFMPMQSVAPVNGAMSSGVQNKYKDFNKALSLIMGGDRLLKADDYMVAYDWLEVFGMDEECALTMISYAIHEKYKRGNKTSFSTLNKLAMRWADLGIKTVKEAEDHVAHKKLINSGAATILKHLGIYGREPTKDEYDLFLKWVDEYGFKLDAILKACSEMVYSKNPNFKLLDSILTKYKDQNAMGSYEMEQASEKQKQQYQLYQEIIKRCGIRGNPTEAHKKLIDGWQEAGLSTQGLLYISEYIMDVNGGMPKMKEVVSELLENKTTDENQICELLEKRDKGQKVVSIKKENPALKYDQRSETKTDKEMFDNI